MTTFSMAIPLIPHYPPYLSTSPKVHHATLHGQTTHTHQSDTTDSSSQTCNLEQDRRSSSSITTTLDNQGLSPSTSKTNSMSLDLDVEDDQVDEDGFRAKRGVKDKNELLTLVDHQAKVVLLHSKGFKGEMLEHHQIGQFQGSMGTSQDEGVEEEEDQTIEVYPYIPSPSLQAPSPLPPPTHPRHLPSPKSGQLASVGLGLNFGPSQPHPSVTSHQEVPIRRRGSSIPPSHPVSIAENTEDQGVGGKMVGPPLTVEAPTPIIDEIQGESKDAHVHPGMETEEEDGLIYKETTTPEFHPRGLKAGADEGLQEALTYPIMINGIYDTTHGPIDNQNYPPSDHGPIVSPETRFAEGDRQAEIDREPPSPLFRPVRLGEIERSFSAGSGLSSNTFGSNLTARGLEPSVFPPGPVGAVVVSESSRAGLGAPARRYPFGSPRSPPSSEPRTNNGHLSPGSRSTGDPRSRRMSRKQAPVLTESLENLALGGSEVTLPLTDDGSGVGSGSGLGLRSELGVAMELGDMGRKEGPSLMKDGFGNQVRGGSAGARDRGMESVASGRLFTVYPDPAFHPDGEGGPDPPGWLQELSMDRSPMLSFSRLARIGSRGTGPRSPSSPSTVKGPRGSIPTTGRTVSMAPSLVSESVTTASARRASAGANEPYNAGAGIEAENKKRHSSFLGLGAASKGFGERRKSDAGLMQGSGASSSAPVESTSTIKPARALSPRLLMVPSANKHKPSTSNGQQRKPPIIPARQDSLPVDPASPRGILGNNPSGGVSGLSGASGSTTQLPLDHFLFGQTPGDVISTITSNDARRPSEQTFMTGYSLGGGAITSTDDEMHGPAGCQGGSSRTIDLGNESDDGRGFPLPWPPSSSARRSVVDMVQPPLFTRISASTVTVASNTTNARPREDLPFGASRKDLTSSGPTTPNELLADGFSTPRPLDLTPSSSFLRKDRPNVMYANELGEHSRRSIKTTTINRRPVQWAELDALEEEEARMRAESRREERSRRVEEKKESKKVKRQGLAKRLTGGSRTGYSTDTSSDGTKSKREGFRERRARLKQESEVFDALKDTIPGYDDLMAASMIQVRDETGTKIEFGKLVSAGLGKRYVVIFIRHWYCPLCAQYTESIIRTIDQEALDRASVELIIIGNGSYKMIPGYSKSIKCPFNMYTDPKLKLYRALGMTRQTGDAGEEDEKGDYIRMSTLESTWEVAKRASKMPIKNPGHFTQIGGEFIFSGPTECSYAHRMSNTRNHAPIRDIVALAGVRLDFYHGDRGSPPPAIHRPELNENTQDGMVFGNWSESGVLLSAAERYAMESRRESEGDGWLVAREEELERVRLARQGRRSNAGLEGGADGGACMPQILSGSEAEAEGYVPKDRPDIQRAASRFVEMMDSPTEP